MLAAFRALALSVLLATSSAVAGTLEDADAAFDAGDSDRALALYDEVLAQEPDQSRALLRSGMLLSWERRFDEALGRYDRLLALEPANRDAAYERAKMLSWDRRYDEAIGAFRQLLAADPLFLQARLALARTLGWSGAYADARVEYARVLEREPRNVDALVGTAQTWAWSGRLTRARESYEGALEISPQDRAARLGLAYVHLWTGDAATADRMARELEERFPDDAEVRELRWRSADAAGPTARVGTEHVADTDDNELDVLRLEGGLAVHARIDLTMALWHHEMSDPTGDAQHDTGWIGVSWRPSFEQRVAARVGVDRREATTGASESETVGNASWSWGVGQPWQVTLSGARDALRYSPTITDNGIVIDEARLEGNGRPGPLWRAHAAGAFGDVSDGNERPRVDAGFMRRVRARSPRLEAGYALAWMDYDLDLDGGYFDPQDFLSHLARLEGSGEFGVRRWDYGFGLDAGVQSFTHDGVETSNDAVWIVSAQLGIPLGRALRLRVFGNRGDYAAQTAGGFESWQIGLRLGWSGGPP